MMNEPLGLISELQAAQLFNRSRRTLHRWRQQSLIEYFKLANGRICYDAQQIKRFIERSRRNVEQNIS